MQFQVLLEQPCAPRMAHSSPQGWVYGELHKQCLKLTLADKQRLNRFCLSCGITNIGRRGQSVQLIFYRLWQLQ